MRTGRLIKFTSIGAGAAFRSLFSRENVRQYLADRLLDQTGLPAKIGQMIAMRAGIPATTPSTRMTLPEVRQLIEDQCPGLAAELDEIADHPKVASLSQVHRGRLRSGQDVAIKIQFPDVASQIDSQLDDFLSLAARSPARAFGFSREAWGIFLAGKLREELDYQQEAIYQKEARNLFKNTRIIVPDIITEFSSSKILTQTFEPSTEVLDVRGAGIPVASAASLMVQYLADSLFNHRLIHCDLNPGNYGFRRIDGGTTAMVLYDFGAMQQIDPRHITALAKVVTAAPDKEAALPREWMALLCELGFDGSKLDAIRDHLNPVMASLLQPFSGDTHWDPVSWHPGNEIDKHLGDGRWWFRMAGPPWFLYLMRSVQGWHSGLKTLAARVDTRPLREAALRMENQKESQSSAMQSGKINEGLTRPTPQWKSSHLMVRVDEGTETVVAVELPVAAIENLADLVPDEVRSSLSDRGIDLAGLGGSLMRQGAPPGVVFEESSGRRHYKVWLEKK